MRIISKFRDFYDGVQGTFQDTDMRWLRKSPFAKEGAPEEPVFGMGNQPCKLIDSVLETEKTDFTVVPRGARWFVLGFCGKVYFLVEDTSDEVRKRIGYADPEPQDLIWSLEDWKQRHAKNFKKNKIPKHHIKRVTDFFVQTPKPEVLEIFQEYHTPLFFLRQIRNYYPDNPHWTALFVNTVSLEGLGWQKRMDAFTTYQEIMMFLGSMAHPEPHMTQVSDKDQLVKKGFDFRTSFRHPVK